MKPPVRVLAYHSLVPCPGDPLGVAPEEFRFQMNWLAQRGWRCISLSEWVWHLERGTRPRHPSFVVTFDDGYADCLHAAAPVLLEHGWRATVFVVTAALERGSPLDHDRDLPMEANGRRSMTWEEAASLRDLGFDLESHTCRHLRLTTLDPGTCRAELTESAEVLRRKLGVPANLLCYPQGNVDAGVVAEARAAGYHGGVVTARSAGVPSSLWTIHRTGIYAHDSRRRFQFKLGPLFPSLRSPWLRVSGTPARFGRIPRTGRMRVLQVTSSSDLGGIERMMQRLIPALAREEIQAEVLALRGGGAAEGFLAAHGIVMGGLEPRGIAGQVLALKRRVAQGGYDVIHAYGTRALVVSRLAAALLGRDRPRVVTGILSTVWCGRFAQRILERITRRWNDVYVANSRAGALTLRSGAEDDVAGVARADAGAGINAAANADAAVASTSRPRVRVIHDGIENVPPRPDRPSREEVRASLGLGPNDQVLISVANLRPMKGHRTLLAAMERVTAERRDARLLLVGEDRMAGRLQRRAAESFKPGTVFFLGLRNDIDDLLGAADLFVLASDWEGLPISLLEAMRAALPIVATEVSGIPEAIGHGNEGLLVPSKRPDLLSAALCELLRNPEAGADMGKRARDRFLELFRLEHMAKNLALLYREEIRRGGFGRNGISRGEVTRSEIGRNNIDRNEIGRNEIGRSGTTRADPANAPEPPREAA